MKLAAHIESTESRRPAIKASNEQLTITLIKSGREIGLLTFSPDEVAIEVYGSFVEHPDYNAPDLVSFTLPKKITVKEKPCTHLITTAIYENRKLQGYQCNSCGFRLPVNPIYQKRKTITVKEKECQDCKRENGRMCNAHELLTS